jgi:predicted AlkP superfamily phosphohydrolase/phosphomutase
MRLSARVLLIGLDAAEATVFHDIPGAFLASAAERSASGWLGGNHGFLTDTVWPEIRTGTSAAQNGVYFQPNQVRTGESRIRARRPDELDPERFYWNLAAQSGRQVAAIDQPLTPMRPDGPAIELGEWGTHDRIGFDARPVDVSARRVVDRHGDHPVWSCDAINNGRRNAGERLLAGIRAGVDRKTSLVAELLALREWDLFTASFSEGHCVGHHFWPTDASQQPEAVAAVYTDLDGALRSIVEGAGNGSTVIVYCSHGMSTIDHGSRFVPAVLQLMGLAPPRSTRRRSIAVATPPGLRRWIRRLVKPATLQKLGLTSDLPLDDPKNRAIPVPNSRHGAIRLSLAGRDPAGVIEPGSDIQRRVVEDIRRVFSSLRSTETGQRVVEDVLLLDEVLGTDRHPDLPDLIVRFRTDIGVIGDCRSDTLGIIRVPIPGFRTGEHGTPGAIWAMGPGIEPGTDLGDVRTVDIAPTVLSLLDIPIPDWIDGTPIPGIVG